MHVFGSHLRRYRLVENIEGWIDDRHVIALYIHALCICEIAVDGRRGSRLAMLKFNRILILLLFDIKHCKYRQFFMYLKSSRYLKPFINIDIVRDYTRNEVPAEQLNSNENRRIFIQFFDLVLQPFWHSIIIEGKSSSNNTHNRSRKQNTDVLLRAVINSVIISILSSIWRRFRDSTRSSRDGNDFHRIDSPY